MNRDEAKVWIEKLADRYRRRKKTDPEWYESYIKIIDMLSKEIYSQNSHFVYELIQNAEDNSYHPQCRDRFVEFTLDDERIVVRNNEVGFSAENVKALCSVAESNKVDKTLGYVGEKGIGFKSVFKVSSGPQIHSNGFHFAFDKEMIVPHWCDPPEDVEVDPAVTTIVLPLRDSIRNDPEQALWHDFVGLPAETLLFLSKLSRIRIHDRSSGMSRELARRGARDGLVVIDDGESSSHWRVHRRKIEVPPWLAEAKRKDVRHRELILGFLTDARGSCLRPESAPVFAFLPTNLRPGLPFLVQGDFLTAANRESIHEGDAWNRWLRDELAPTYLEALRQGVNESKTFRNSFLQTLPLLHEVASPFFKPVAKQILDAIVRERLFPGESGRLRTVDEVFRGDAILRRLFPSESLPELLDRDVEYLDSRFKIPDAVEQYLPRADISRELTNLLSHQDWLDQQDDDWFIDLYGYLNDHPELVDDDDLKGLPIVRLEGGRLAAADEDTIYLPPSTERVEDSYGLKQFEFRIVSHAIVRRIPNTRKEEGKLLNQRTQAAQAFLLDHLDVKYHRALEITWNQILPHFENKNHSSVDDLKTDFGLVLYVKEYWGQIQKDVDDDEANFSLADIISAFGRLPIPAIGVRKRREVRNVTEVYLPPELGGDGTLSRLFQGVPDVWFVDAELLVEWDTTRKRKERKLKEWQAFLAEIGAARSLRLSPEKSRSVSGQDFRIPPEFAPGDRVTRIENHLQIKDLDSLFEYMAEKATSTRSEKGRHLLKLLDRQWSVWKNQVAQNRIGQGNSPWWESTYWYYPGTRSLGRQESKSLPCAFIQQLRGESWAPVRSDGPPLPPEEVWVSDNDGGLGFAAGRSLALGVDDPELVKALGFRTHLTVAELLAEVKGRKARGELDINGYRQLYSLLDQAWQREGNGQLTFQEFQSVSRLIFLPNRPEFPFAASDEVVWKPGRQRNHGFPSLEGTYPSLREFFQKLGVAERATPQLALEAMGQVSDSSVDLGDLDRARLREAYETLADADFARDGGAEELQIYRESGTLLGEDGRFYPCRELVAPDDPELARLFRDHGIRPFLWLPGPDGDGAEVARHLARLFGLKRVSDARPRVYAERDERGRESEDLIARFNATRRSLIGFIRKNASKRYEELQSCGQAAALANAPTCFCAVLNLSYEFDGRIVDASREHAIFVDPTGIYLRADRFDLEKLGSDLQAALNVDGLADGFFTLMSLPSDRREPYAERQGYVVPDSEWQGLAGEQIGPIDGDGNGRRQPTDRRRTLPEGKPYSGPVRYQPPRASNERLIRRLGRKPKRREAKEYLEGPPAEPEPVGTYVPDENLPNRIKTTLRAANLEYGFLRFAPDDFRIFEPDCPSQIELLGDDGECVKVAVDYKQGILHDGKLTEFLEPQAWPYGTFLCLEATSIPDRFHLHAQPVDQPLSIEPVAYFDLDEQGQPVTRTSYPEPFAVRFDENVYRQERRWENRRAYDALVALKGDGVLTAVFNTLERSPGPMSAAAIHRSLMADGRPCSYFSVLAVLYGYECFEVTDDHKWNLAATRSKVLRDGYRADGGEPGEPNRTIEPPSSPVTLEEFNRLGQRLGRHPLDLSRTKPDKWVAAIDHLLQKLESIKRSFLEESDQSLKR